MAVETKQRILESAERIFCEHGYAGASLRAIIADAGVNLAAVNYHFRSKEELLKAVLERRLGPVNEERLRLLDVAEMAAAPKAPPLEEIIDAMLMPMLRLHTGRDGSVIQKVLMLMYGESGKLVRGFFAEQMEPVVKRFFGALCRALPELPPEDVAWRMFFSMGAAVHLLRSGEELMVLTGGLCDAGDAQGTIPRLVSYIGAGMRGTGG